MMLSVIQKKYLKKMKQNEQKYWLIKKINYFWPF